MDVEYVVLSVQRRTAEYAPAWILFRPSWPLATHPIIQLDWLCTEVHDKLGQCLDRIIRKAIFLRSWEKNLWVSEAIILLKEELSPLAFWEGRRSHECLFYLCVRRLVFLSVWNFASKGHNCKKDIFVFYLLIKQKYPTVISFFTNNVLVALETLQTTMWDNLVSFIT